MRLEYEFTVPVPVPRAWAVLLDVERVAPCVPGATLSSFDGDAFAGAVKVRLGPISLTYQGKGRFVSREYSSADESSTGDSGTVVIEASGRDARGAGTAAATATVTMRPAETDGSDEAPQAHTVVTIAADLTVTGRPAQFGRGMIAEVGGKLVGQFATCLAARLAEAPAAAGIPTAVGSIVDAEPAAPPVALAGGVGGTGAEPVDLLRVGAGPVLRRIGPLLVAFVAGGLVGWALFTWLG